MTGTQVAAIPVVNPTNDQANHSNTTPSSLIKNNDPLHQKAVLSGTNGGPTNAIGILHSSTIPNGTGAGDSKKLSKEPEKKDVVMNGAVTADSSSHKLSSHILTPGNVLKNECSELDKNLVAVDLKNLKDNSLLVNNLKSLGVDVRASTTTGTPPASSSAVAAVKAGGSSVKALESAQETDESSSDSGCDDDAEERMLRQRWERDRANVAWRWHWLDLQSRELQHQVHLADQQYLRQRRIKQPIAPALEDNDPMQSLRTSGMTRLKKSRKLCRRAPMNLSGRIMEGAEHHPLFYFQEYKRATQKPPALLPGLQDPSSPIPNPATPPQVKTEQPKRRRDSCRKEKREKEKEKEEVKTEMEEDDTATRPSRKRRNTRDELGSPLFTPPSTPTALSTPKTQSEKRKKTLRTSDFDIDNVVLPYAAGSSCVIPAAPHREIRTPTWRSVSAPDFAALGKQSRKKRAVTPSLLSPDPSPHSSTTPSPITSPVSTDAATPVGLVLTQSAFLSRSVPDLVSSGHKLNVSDGILERSFSSDSVPTEMAAFQANVARLRAAQPKVKYTVLGESTAELPVNSGDSSGEDTSDEAYALRHAKQEYQERQRYLAPIKKKDANGSESSITDVFVMTDDLLASYSPSAAGPLLGEQLFEARVSSGSDTPTGSLRRSDSLCTKKERLKEKFAKIRNSYAFGEPPKSRSRALLSSSTSGDGNCSDDSSHKDGDDDVEEEEEEYLQKPPPRRRDRRRDCRRSSSSSSTRRRSRRSASSASSSTVPSQVNSPELSDEYDSDAWEAACDKSNWWWDPKLHWQVDPLAQVPSAEGATTSLCIRLKLCKAPVDPTTPISDKADTESNYSFASETASESATPPAQDEVFTPIHDFAASLLDDNFSAESLLCKAAAINTLMSESLLEQRIAAPPEGLFDMDTTTTMYTTTSLDMTPLDATDAVSPLDADVFMVDTEDLASALDIPAPAPAIDIRIPTEAIVASAEPLAVPEALLATLDNDIAADISPMDLNIPVTPVDVDIDDVITSPSEPLANINPASANPPTISLPPSSSSSSPPATPPLVASPDDEVILSPQDPAPSKDTPSIFPQDGNNCNIITSTLSNGTVHSDFVFHTHTPAS